MAKSDNGYASAKGATAAARKTLGKDVVLGAEFEVFEIEGGRWDWKAVERKKQPRRTSTKAANPFEAKGPSAAEVKAAEAQIEAATQEAPAADETAPVAEVVTEDPVVLGPTLDDMPIPGTSDDHMPSKGASAFGMAAMAALGNNGSERSTQEAGGANRTADKAPKKVRAPSEIVNGVRKPSEGTTCRHVWDELDRIREEQQGTPPDSKQVKDLATRHKWNGNNASIEFYQWRKFNGISGRVKTSAVLAKPAKA